MTPPPRALVERFAADWRALIALEPSAAGPLALAVSGGPDSMAMLALGAAAFPGAVIAATVDHGLRAEAADEAAMVARACAGLGVAHRTLAVEGAPGQGDNLHVWARERRYALLDDWACAAGAVALLTAHHADDQAETFLMRAARGSGLAGLAGIRAVNPGNGVSVVRPLLGWRRVELEAVARAAALPFVRDPSNADPRFDRARMRGWLAEADLDPAAIARSAGYLAEADSDLRAVAVWLLATRAVTGDGELSVDIAGLPRGVRRLIARAAIAELRRRAAIAEPAFGEASNVEPLLDALELGKAATQAGVLVCPKGSLWHFVKAPARRSH